MATEDVSVRIMREKDIPAMVEIDRMAGGAPRADYIQGKAKEALDTRFAMVVSLVAERQGKVVGFLMGEVFRGEFGIPEGVAWVDTVGVHPEERKHGVGTRLMEEFMGHVAKAGVQRVRTMVGWEQWDMMRYFRKAGFAPGSTIVLEREV